MENEAQGQGGGEGGKKPRPKKKYFNIKHLPLSPIIRSLNKWS